MDQLQLSMPEPASWRLENLIDAAERAERLITACRRHRPDESCPVCRAEPAGSPWVRRALADDLPVQVAAR